jgi:uncharacterized protein YxjI
MSTALAKYQSQYVAQKALFAFLGGEFRLFDTANQLAFFVKQKAFKLKEEITVFSDEAQTKPMLRIKARSIMDISATYDVTDADTGAVIGALRRKGLKSILRDEWAILGAGDAEVGMIQEDSGFLALVRRFLIKIIPQTFKVTMGGEEVGQIKQRFTFFRLTYDVDFSKDTSEKLDRRIIVASTVLLLAIEGRQG